MFKDSIRNNKVTVIGLARSGEASANLLHSLGAKVFVSEAKNNLQLQEMASKLELRGINVELGKHSVEFIKNSILLILSPGVPPTSEAVKIAKSLRIPMISEIELGFRLCSAPIIAVTGTNGKTTVTSLIGEILRKTKKRVFVLGNIGRPFCSQIAEINNDDFVVLEISSFQLETVIDFKPKVAVVLNLTPDHMDRYKDIDEYLEAKKRIQMNQDGNDYLVLNFDDLVIRSLSNSAKAKALFFGSNLCLENGKKLNHNFLAAMVVGEIFGVSREEIYSVFDNFKGVEHRIEFVRSLEGIEYINDSKATNIDSTLWAFNNISKPIVLIAGGREKGSDFKSIREDIRRKVKLMVVVGEAKDKIVNAFSDILPIKIAEDFPEAVSFARSGAKSGDCILLSPMCKSFDMFESYEHRGKVFKELVNNLR